MPYLRMRENAYPQEQDNTTQACLNRTGQDRDQGTLPFHLVQWYQDKVMDSLRKAEYRRIKKEAEKARVEADDLMAQAKKMFDSRFFLMTSRTALETKDKENRQACF